MLNLVHEWRTIQLIQTNCDGVLFTFRYHSKISVDGTDIYRKYIHFSQDTH